jgi:chromosome segregation ATPase
MATVTLAKYQHDIAEKQKAQQDLYEKVAERDSDIEAQKVQIQTLQNGTRELQQWKKDHLADVGQHQSQIVELEIQLKLLQSGNSEVQTSWSEERLHLEQEHQLLKGEKERAIQDAERLEKEIVEIRSQLVTSQQQVESLESDCVSRKEDFDELEEDTHLVHEFFNNISDRFAPVLKDLGKDATPENLRNYICGLGTDHPSLRRRGSANSYDSMLSRDFPNASIDGKGYRQASIGDELARIGSNHEYDSLDHKFGDDRDLLFEDSMLDLGAYELGDSDEDAASLRIGRHQGTARSKSRDSVFSNGASMPLPKVRARKGVAPVSGFQHLPSDDSPLYQSIGTQYDNEHARPMTPIDTPTRATTASARDEALSKVQHQKIEQLQAEINSLKHQHALRSQNTREACVMTELAMSELSERAGQEVKDAHNTIAHLKDQVAQLQTQHDDAQETAKLMEVDSRSKHDQLKDWEMKHSQLKTTNAELGIRYDALKAEILALKDRNSALESDQEQALVAHQSVVAKSATLEADLAERVSELRSAEDCVRQWQLKQEESASEFEATRRTVSDLESANANLSRMSEALRQQIAALEDEKTKATEIERVYRALVDEHDAIKDRTAALENVLQSKAHAEEECEKLQVTIDSLQTDLAEHKDLQAQHDALRKENAELSTTQQAYVSLQAEYNSLDADIKLTRSSLEEKAAETLGLEKQINSLQKSQSDIQGELEDVRLDNVKVQDELEALSRLRATLETDIVERDRTAEIRQDDLEGKIASLETATREKERLQAERDDLLAKLDEVSATNVKNDDKLKLMEEELENARGIDATNSELRDKINALEKDLEALNAEKTLRGAEFESLQGDYRRLQDVRSENKGLQERIESFENTATLNAELQEKLSAMQVENDKRAALVESLDQQLIDLRLAAEKSTANAHDQEVQLTEFRTKEEKDAGVIQDLQNELAKYQSRIESEAANAQNLQDQLETVRNEVVEHATALQAARDQLGMAGITEEKNTELIRALSDQLEISRSQYEASAKTIQDLANQLQSAQRTSDELKSIRQDNTDLQKKIDGLLAVEEKSVGMQGRIEGLLADLANLRKTEEENTGLLSAMTQLKVQLADSESISAARDDLRQRCDELSLRVTSLQAVDAQNAELKRTITTLEDDVQQLKSINADNDDLMTKFTDLEQTAASLREASTELAELQMKYDGLQSESGELLSQHQTLKVKYDDLEDENDSQTLEIRKLKLAKPDTSNLEYQIDEQEKVQVGLHARISELGLLNEYQADENRKLRSYAEQSESEDKKLIIKLDTEIKYLNGKTTQLENDKKTLKSQVLQSKLSETTHTAGSSFFRDASQGRMCVAARQRSPLHVFLHLPWWLHVLLGLMFVAWAGMTFAAYQERSMWLRANDNTHRQLRSIMARRASHSASCSLLGAFWEVLSNSLSHFD